MPGVPNKLALPWEKTVAGVACPKEDEGGAAEDAALAPKAGTLGFCGVPNIPVPPALNILPAGVAGEAAWVPVAGALKTLPLKP